MLASDLPAHNHAFGGGADNVYVQPPSGTEAAYINAANYGQPGTLVVSYGPVTDDAYGQTTNVPTVTPTLAADFIIWAQ